MVKLFLMATLMSGGALAAAAPSFAEQGLGASEGPKPIAAASAHGPDAVICRVEPHEGSRIAKVRICLTRARWTEISRRSADTLEKIQNKADTSPLP